MPAGPAGPTGTPTLEGAVKPKVLLLGWDAAEWEVVHPLIERGEMPALARLIEEGVMPDISTLEPVLSPMLTRLGRASLAVANSARSTGPGRRRRAASATGRRIGRPAR